MSSHNPAPCSNVFTFLTPNLFESFELFEAHEVDENGKPAVQLNTAVEEKSVKGNLDEGPQETMGEDSFVADRSTSDLSLKNTIREGSTRNNRLRVAEKHIIIQYSKAYKDRHIQGQ